MSYADPSLHREALRANQARYIRTEKGRKTHAKLKRLITKSKNRTAPFVGVDGEGGGTDDLGRQNYLLLRAGDNLLFNGNTRLTSYECLDFLSSLDSSPIYVSFFFDYDTTHILRDIPVHKLTELLSRRLPTQNRADTILWENFEIGYFPRKHLKVRRIGTKPWIIVHDVGTFFQTAFVNVLDQWDVLETAQRAQIRADKARRHEFERMTEREIAYNKLECDALAEVMTKFREICLATMGCPRQWEGPGQLAAAMLGEHEIPKTKKIAEKIPPDCWAFANDAYYGGRFEIFKVGHVKNVTEYDICSAYPHACLSLPCLLHGTWLHSMGRKLPKNGSLYVADVRFTHVEENAVVCNLPFRTEKGNLRWPREGNGRYWSVEIEAAERAGTIIAEFRECWVYERNCDCNPFGKWVTAVYEQRRSIGKNVQGYPIKLALNSIYGKCCQSIGHPPYANPIYGGLITATTRAKLIEAYRNIAPERLVMLATDGVYATGELLDLPLGTDLGQWEAGKPDGIFLIKPGMYAWDHGVKVKTRGVPKALFEEKFPCMQHTFKQWLKIYRDWPANLIPYWPEETFQQTLFIGSRLGLNLRPPNYAGKWIKREVRHSFDPTIKRRPAEAHPSEGHFITYAHLGGPNEKSTYYNKAIGGHKVTTEIEKVMVEVIERGIFEAQVDAENFELSISGLDDGTLFDDDEELSLEDIV